ncbi:hypothetical protein OAX78_03540, partial [Planctomycetota bacterium]|nr:hypothetical protein [Planctomycetota bacterium]
LPAGGVGGLGGTGHGNISGAEYLRLAETSRRSAEEMRTEDKDNATRMRQRLFDREHADRVVGLMFDIFLVIVTGLTPIPGDEAWACGRLGSRLAGGSDDAARIVAGTDDGARALVGTTDEAIGTVTRGSNLGGKSLDGFPPVLDWLRPGIQQQVDDVARELGLTHKLKGSGFNPASPNPTIGASYFGRGIEVDQGILAMGKDLPDAPQTIRNMWDRMGRRERIEATLIHEANELSALGVRGGHEISIACRAGGYSRASQKVQDFLDARWATGW